MRHRKEAEERSEKSREGFRVRTGPWRPVPRTGPGRPVPRSGPSLWSAVLLCFLPVYYSFAVSPPVTPRSSPLLHMVALLMSGPIITHVYKCVLPPTCIISTSDSAYERKHAVFTFLSLACLAYCNDSQLHLLQVPPLIPSCWRPSHQHTGLWGTASNHDYTTVAAFLLSPPMAFAVLIRRQLWGLFLLQ